jgi:hypothetical protein
MSSCTYKHNQSLSILKKATACLAVLLGALLLVSFPLYSQGAQGAIQGSVFDQSGAVIAGATVMVIDVARGVARNLVADDAGQYVASSLNPGTYTVRAEFKGFSTQERTGVVVEVGQTIRVDLKLQAGEQTQTITVTGEIPSIDTTDSTLGGTVSNSAILSLPLNGRNFFRLLELRPGVITDPGAQSGASSTNGRRLGADLLVVEGIPQIELTTANTTINGNYKGGGDSSNLLPIDAVQEFNTQQNPKAEFGWRDGSVVSVGVKSGTNSLHGSAYAFGRDASATDAANFFTSQVTPATLEQFGATAGGRIIKDKLFVFGAFEGLRVNVGSVATDTIPADVAMGNANFSMVDACNAVKAANLANPGANPAVSALSAQLSGLSHFQTGDPASCAVTPASSSFENLFPFTTNTNTTANFLPGFPSTAPLNNGLIKGDWNVSVHHHFSGMYYISKSTANSYATANILAQWFAVINNNTQDYDGDWTWTPNSTVVNDVRMGYSYGHNQSAYSDQANVASSPWPSGYGINTGVTNPLYGGMPNIQITGFSGQLGVGGRSGIRGPDGEAQFSESLSYLRGNHAFKFGVQYVDAVLDENPYSQTQGVVKFKSLQTFLAGTVNTATILNGDPSVNRRQHWYAGFAQDDWRVTTRVTMNLGLRYEYYGSPKERNNLFGTFNPSAGTATTPALQQVTGNLYTPEKTDFSPRIGFAWDVRGNGKTVIRAGGGLMTSIVAMPSLTPLVPWGANFPSLGVVTTGTNANLHTANPLSLSGTQVSWTLAGPVFPISSTGPSCTLASPCSTGAPNPNFRQPRSAQWNLDIQRAITNSLTLDVAYVGNHGFREQFSADLNNPATGAGWDTKAVGNCLSAASVAANYNNCKPTIAAEVGPYSLQFPYLNYIVRAFNNNYSNYDGLQVTVDERLAHGISFLAGYTYSHALDIWSKNSNGTAMATDPNNLRLDYGNGDHDIRNRFTFSPSYLIPGVKSPGQMLEGWSVSSIVVLQGGLPWFADDNATNDFAGTGENKDNFNSSNSGVIGFWNYTGPRSAFDATATPIPCYGVLASCTAFAAAPASIQSACLSAAQAPYAGNAQLQQLAVASLANNACYIQNGGVLTPPAYGTLGNAGRNTFRGQPYYNVDLSISKIWHMKERYSAQFRAEFFNLFNRADFAAPSIDPSAGVSGGFGYGTSTPDSTNAVLGSGGPRHIQFGLKLMF